MIELNDYIIRLIGEYLIGEIDEARRIELMMWVEESKENKVFFEKVRADRSCLQRLELRKKIDVRSAIDNFDYRTSQTEGKSISLKKWIGYTAIAASIVVVLTISFLSLNNQKDMTPVIAQTEIIPGSPKAILVLSDGKEVGLEGKDSLDMNLAAGARLVSLGQKLVYEGGKSDVIQYNELKIPKGGEYQVVLADGSVIRLNSGSSLKYPVTFSGDKREVELTGEAYFEVTKSTAPFLVKVGDITVKVYGTTFNINTHMSGRIQTALVEGKVGITVKGDAKEFILKPSQLADFNTRTLAVNIQQTDITPYVAWINGLFIFTNQSLKEIMNTLALWYDMDVFFQNPALQQLHFTGSVKRYDRIDNILNALMQTVGVKFNQRGKTLTISY